MKKLVLALAMSASVLSAAPAMAQDQNDWHHGNGRYNQNYDDHSDDRQDGRRDRRDDRRDWRQYRRYDYNHPGPNSAYYADRYYRDGRYYQPRRLSYNDRIYRGNDGRYYCRRSDGTTGLIIGAGAGALLGNALSSGHSGLLGTLLGAGVGGAIGNSVDRGSVTCR